MDGHDPHASSGGGNSKLLLACGGCCLFLLIGSAIGGYFAVQQGAAAMRDLAAMGVETVAEESFKGLALPQAEIDAAMQPVEAFGGKIRAGQVSMQQGLAVMQAIGEGHVPAVVMVRGFELKHLQPSGLSDAEKQAGYVTATRFAYGAAEDLIARPEREAVMEMLLETKTTQVNGQTRTTKQFKESLTDEELLEVLTEMKNAADAVGVPEGEQQVDLVAEIEDAIQYGMDNPVQ